jgi:hypothetical protein
MARSMSLLEKVAVEVLDAERRLFRVCAGPDVEEAEIAFRSHYELRRPPRGPESRAAVIHMALSMFDRAGPLVGLGPPGSARDVCDRCCERRRVTSTLGQDRR